MTLPRKLTLHKTHQEYHLKNYPISTLGRYESNPVVLPTIQGGNTIDAEALQQSHITFEVTDTSKDFAIVFSNDLDESYRIGYDAKSNTFYTDRRQSGQVAFEARFAEHIHTAPGLSSPKDPAAFSIYLDASSSECFINEGAIVLTDQLFPNSPYTHIQFIGEETHFEHIKITNIDSIWK